MPALLDTNAFLWFISGSDRLSGNARDYMVDFDNELVLSAASLWEIAIKTSLGKLELLSPFDQLIPVQLQKNAIDVLPIELDHLSVIINLEFHHRDPFDRLIIAQGITEQIPVITSDAMFAKYPVEVIW
ncbi:MAG: type II toxin-antitoxin system VapC family toxin [Deltaproteobacteria bacterium]|jgi:PIN domain nuclease of toxin-antitoxin system|nr:type II toxin-antitoxin system VapC family toxin [Deltaproteobacteria bacterium]